MWPILLDMTKEESMQNLRSLELEAYANLVSALRAQGPLNSDKRKLLKDTSIALSISQDRHKAEIRRAINDEKLNTIAYHVTGLIETDDWALEGRRIVPLLPRMAPQTAYSAIADEAADSAYEINKQLPHPTSTERKRPQSSLSNQISLAESSKSSQFRIPEPPKTDDSKKRKLPTCTENSTLAQHLLGPPKMSRIQHVYKQRTKLSSKDQMYKPKRDDLVQQKSLPMKTQQKIPLQPSSNGPKINVLQNISLQADESTDQVQNELSNYPKKPEQNHILSHSSPGCSNENQMVQPKLFSLNQSSITFKQLPSSAPLSNNSEIQKTLKVCPIRKPVSKPITPGQKLIVVSNTQTLSTNSILQKTLSGPFVKNISMKNLEKFKIVTTAVSSSNLIPSSTNSSISINPVKHKVVTVKTNPTKKVFHISQLLGSKGGIKVLPLGGKIVGKASTTTSPSLIISMSNVQNMAKNTTTTPIVMTTPVLETNSIVCENVQNLNETVDTSPKRENGKSSVLGDILKASGVTADDFSEHDQQNVEEIEVKTVVENYEEKESQNVQGETLNTECNNERNLIELQVIESASHSFEQPVIANDASLIQNTAISESGIINNDDDY